MSVVLPVKDGARYLREAVDSVLAQSLSDFELIAVDDGSSDESPAILAAYAARDRRVRVLRKPSEGLVAALNLGCRSARAPYIARMDADDVSLPDRFERQVAFLAEHPKVVLLGTGHTEIDEAGRTIGVSRYPTSPEAVAARIVRKNCLAHPTVMFSRAVFEEVGGYRPALLHGEDYDLWLRIGDRHAIANLAEPLVAYRVHPSSVSIRNRRQQVISMLGAQVAARRRRSGADDGLRNVELVTVEVLVGLGMEPAEIARNIFAACSAEAERALAAGNDDTAWRFCVESLACSPPLRLTRAERGHIHRIAAIAAFNERHAVRALRSFAAGLKAQPSLLGGPFRRFSRTMSRRRRVHRSARETPSTAG